MDRSDEGTINAATVIAVVESRWGSRCSRCSVALIGHDVVLSMLMGLRDAPRCIACLAASVGDEREPFTDRAHRNVRRLGCYAAGWRHSDRRLAALGSWPEERVPAALRLDVWSEPGTAGASDVPGPDDAAAGPRTRATASFDAGQLGCGNLLLELRTRLSALSPGEVLEVRATDPGAPGDLPAWCRVTRHTLLRSEPPLYWIRRRDDD